MGIGAAEARTWLDGVFERAKFATPVLHIYEEGDPAITPQMDLIRSLTRSDRTLVKIDRMRHIDFTSLGFGAVAVPGLTGPSSPLLADKVRAVAGYTLLFVELATGGKPVAPRAEPQPWLHVERIGR